MTQYPLGQISFSCGKCGSSELEIVDSDDEKSEVRCPKCGESMGTLSDLREAAIKQAKAAMPDIAKAFSKKMKF
ncbi:hypothetical protein OSJ57_17550 [Sphingomonas sp. HH69]